MRIVFFFPGRIAFANFLLAVVKCVCLQVHLAKDLSRKLLWQMFSKGDFFLIFKIDHPNAESVEIQLLVFDFCWVPNRFLERFLSSISRVPSPIAWKIGGKECPPYHHGPPLPTSTRNSRRGWSTNHHWFPGKPGLCFWWG